MFFQERISRGAAWLDRNYPSWFKRINKQTLNIGKYESCIIGQLFGSYNEWLKNEFDVCPYTYGFDCMHRKQKNFEKLKNLWLTEIERRCFLKQAA